MRHDIPGVLGEICAHKRNEVALLNRDPSHYSRDKAHGAVRDFYGALNKSGTRFIMECKRASPSQGVLRANFSLAQIAQAYKGIADLVSVLTDEHYFGGALSHIRDVRAIVESPILRKDFIVDPIQVYEAYACGADAVLLMFSVLTDETYIACHSVADELGLGVLSEVHTQEELQRAIRLGAKVIGINNRDLVTLKIDLETTKKLAPLIPSDRVIISESGIRDHEDVLALSPMVNGFLVGSSLMSSNDVALAARALAFGSVKVCGLTREEDAKAAYESGACYGGLIFAKASPRYVTLDAAKAVMQGAPLHYVGVFVEHTMEEIIATAKSLRLNAIQLHGEYSEDFIETIKAALPEAEVWRVLSVKNELVVPTTRADRILLDSGFGSQVGGNGTSFAWSLLSAYTDKSHLILAGGISPQNIREAASLGVGVLDVNSGVEQAPGIKSKQALEALFSELRKVKAKV